MKRLGSQVEGVPPRTPAPCSWLPASSMASQATQPENSEDQRAGPAQVSGARPVLGELLPSTRASGFPLIPVLSLIPTGHWPCVRGAWACQQAPSVPQAVVGEEPLPPAHAPQACSLQQRSRWALEPAQATHWPGLRLHGPCPHTATHTAHWAAGPLPGTGWGGQEPSS